MEAIFPCMFVVFIIAVVGGAIWYGIYRSQQLNESFKQLARTYGGSHAEGGWFAYPSCQFPYGQGWVTVDMYSTGGKHKRYYTRVAAPFPDPMLAMQLWPQGFLDSVTQMFGTQDINIGSPAFDSAFVIQGPNPPLVARYLTPHVQNLVNMIYGHYSYATVTISIERGFILVEKQAYIADYESLLQLTQLTLAMSEAAGQQVQQGGGMQYQEPAPIKLEQETMCPVCSSAIDSGAVYCAKCQTAHHRTCWNRTGQCSVYGCGETTYFSGTVQR